MSYIEQALREPLQREIVTEPLSNLETRESEEGSTPEKIEALLDECEAVEMMQRLAEYLQGNGQPLANTETSPMFGHSYILKWPQHSYGTYGGEWFHSVIVTGLPIARRVLILCADKVEILQEAAWSNPQIMADAIVRAHDNPLTLVVPNRQNPNPPIEP
ncbi:hypothetical protein HY024_02880 [Candidatus Curtissbacteria bacterium]|nr:hypothetical protein [Candidatus Curtissbacteria bacterium]